MNVAQKRYKKYFYYIFLTCCLFQFFNSHKIFFLCISTSSLQCVQRLFSKMKLVKTFLHTQLKQANLEN